MTLCGSSIYLVSGLGKAYNHYFTDDESEPQKEWVMGVPLHVFHPPISCIPQLDALCGVENVTMRGRQEKGWWQMVCLNSRVRSVTVDESLPRVTGVLPSPPAPDLLGWRGCQTTFSIAMSRPQWNWQWNCQMDGSRPVSLARKWAAIFP